MSSSHPTCPFRLSSTTPSQASDVAPGGAYLDSSRGADADLHPYGADLMEREGSRDVRRVWNNSVQSCPLYRCPLQVSAQLLRVPMSLSLSQQTPDS
jgi:hypothetical protein